MFQSKLARRLCGVALAAVTTALMAVPAHAQRVSLGTIDSKIDTVDAKVDDVSGQVNVVDGKVDDLLSQTGAGTGGVLPINQDCAEGIGCFPGDLAGLPVTITVPGSYRLTSDLEGVVNVSGIEITVDDVTLDLSGFAVVGTGTSGIGILVNGDNAEVQNGTVRNWGLEGVFANAADNSLFERLRVSDNGSFGIVAGAGSTVSHVVARGNGNDGILLGQHGVVSHSTAQNNTGEGIEVGAGGSVIDSAASRNGEIGIRGISSAHIARNNSFDNQGDGIAAGNGSTVRGNTSTGNDGDGIDAEAACLVEGNTVRLNGLDGIVVGVDTVVRGNMVDAHLGEAGISVPAGVSDTRIDGNHVTDNTTGISVQGPGNLIIRNSAAGNTTDYSIVAGNVTGPVLNTADTDRAFANFDF